MSDTITSNMDIPSLAKTPTEISLFMFSAHLWIPHKSHYDDNYTRQEGHKGLLIQGPLQGAYLAELVSDWLGANGVLKKLSFRHKAPAYVGDTLIAKGKTKTIEDCNDGRLVNCDVWLEKETCKTITTLGEVTLLLSA